MNNKFVRIAQENNANDKISKIMDYMLQILNRTIQNFNNYVPDTIKKYDEKTINAYMQNYSLSELYELRKLSNLFHEYKETKNIYIARVFYNIANYKFKILLTLLSLKKYPQHTTNSVNKAFTNLSQDLYLLIMEKKNYE